ncbi:hypothetical protein MWU65_07730 [Cellulophaga sp. F20128]|uniref:hypothetical protein n=1 Tax=Cellulophaga sp. F20128 TaxID=2926413 RepID=UPI001FF60FF5|nr:hypothetical protein [Cellulophaga sp. F20128]MCK0157063.1 hypothetical protein [Cellulophaga sp. F20128]
MRSIKLHIIKSIAIGIGLLYVLHPLQNQIQSGLHAIAHVIDTSTTINHHHSHTHTNSTTLHSHLSEGTHEHQFITFFNDLFGASDTSGTATFVYDNSIDKHIVNQFYFTVIKHTTPTISFFYRSPDKTSNGYLTSLDKPPQSIDA